MAITLEEMNAEVGKAPSSSSSSLSKSSASASTGAAPGGTASPAKPSDSAAAISLEEMNSQVAADPRQDSKEASWGETLAAVPGQIRRMGAQTIAGAKLASLQELQRGYAEKDPAFLRSERGLKLEQDIEREEVILREIAADNETGVVPDQSTLQKGVSGALVSIPYSLPALAVGLITRNPAMAAWTMAPVTQAQKFGELSAITPQLSFETRFGHAMFQGGVESITELAPFGALLNRAPFGKKLLQVIAAEVPGEIGAHYMQGASDYVAAKQAAGEDITGRTVLEALLAQEDVPVVVISTLIQAGVMTTAMAGVNRLAGYVLENKSKDKPKALDAFDELAVQNKGKAQELAEEIAKTDPKLAKYLKNKIAKFEQASEEELAKVGEAAAKRNMEEMTPDLKEIFKVGEPTADAMLEELKKPAEVEVVEEKPKERVVVDELAGGTRPGVPETDPRYKLFDDMAQTQRGAPEAAMSAAVGKLNDKSFYGTPGIGVFQTLLEHVGDLTHRIGEKGGAFGTEFVAPKVERALRILENVVDMKNLEKMPNIPELAKYALAHQKVPVYNEVQRAARDAAILIGQRRFYEARKELRKVKAALDSGKWDELALAQETSMEEVLARTARASQETYTQTSEGLSQTTGELHAALETLTPKTTRQRSSPADLTLREMATWKSKYARSRKLQNQAVPGLPSPYAVETLTAALKVRPLFNEFVERLQNNGHANDSNHPITAQPDTVAGDLLRNIADTIAEDSPGLAKLYRKIAPFVDEVPVHFVHPRHSRLDGAGGVFTKDGILIGLDSTSSPAWTLRSVVHEGIHAAVFNFMVANPKHPLTQEMRGLMAEAKKRARRMAKERRDSLPTEEDFKNETRNMVEGLLKGMTTEEQVSALAEVDADWRKAATAFQLNTVLRHALRATIDISGRVRPLGVEGEVRNIFDHLYGMVNPHEFVAEAFSSDQFVRFLLASEKYASPTWKARVLWSEFGAIVKRIVGGKDKDASGLLDNVLETGLELMEASRRAKTALGDLNIPDPMSMKERVEEAFDFTIKTVPGVAFTTGKLKAYWNQVVTTFSPESLGPHAKETGAIIARAIALEAQEKSQNHGRSEVRSAFWDKNADMARQFIDARERGLPMEGMLKKINDGYTAWMRRIYEADQAAGLNYEEIDNYTYHIFEDGAAVEAFFMRKYGKQWGQPGFMKDRSFDFYAEAIAAGFKPKYTNPEDIMLARQNASTIAIAKVNMFRELEKYGLAVKAEKGSETPPEGFSSLSRKSPTGQRYWVHQHTQIFMHKLYDTQSLWSKQGFWGDAYRGMLYLKNATVPVLLGLSLFHPLHVATIDNTTGAVRALKLLGAGKVGLLKTTADLGGALMYRGVISSPIHGSRILNIIKGHVPESEITATDRAALMAMADGGFVPEMDPRYRTKARHAFMKAVRQHSSKAIFKLPFAILDASQMIFFEYWIPALKVSSYIKDAKTAVMADPSLLTDDLKRMKAFRKLAKSIDNRYGEMAYNTLFWDKWVKDIGVGATLSLGWQLGFLREYGGAIGDVASMATKPTKLQQKFAEGDFDRPMFVVVQSVQSMLYCALAGWALTGEPPEEWLDYFYFKNGEKNPDGSDQRSSTMFYTKEFAAIAKHWEQEGIISGTLHIAMNKASPVIGMLKEAVTGINFMGEEIRDPNANIFIKAAQTVANAAKNLVPISIRTVIDETGAETPGELVEAMGDNPKLATMATLGFTKAPKYATETKTQGAIKHTFQKYFGQKLKPFERAEYSDEARKLKDLYKQKKMKEYNTLLDAMEERFDLSREQVKRIATAAKKDEDPYLRMFSRLTWEQQKRILDEMTPEERKIYLPRSNKDHLRRKYRPPEE